VIARGRRSGRSGSSAGSVTLEVIPWYLSTLIITRELACSCCTLPPSGDVWGTERTHGAARREFVTPIFYYHTTFPIKICQLVTDFDGSLPTGLPLVTHMALVLRLTPLWKMDR